MFLLLISIVLKILIIVIPLLIAVAYFTIAERKIMGSIQRRKGPNVIGFLGLLQPLADGLKLFQKKLFYQAIPIFSFFICSHTCFRFKFNWLVGNTFFRSPCFSRSKYRNFIFIRNFFVECLRYNHGRLV